jgi:RHS repeat-associated protein
VPTPQSKRCAAPATAPLVRAQLAPASPIRRFIDAPRASEHGLEGSGRAPARPEGSRPYRLIHATGREHAGGVGDVQRGVDDLPLHAVPHANDPTAVRLYEEDYAYDLVGNILELAHTAVGSVGASWTRHHQYESGSNRLASTSLPGDTEGVFPYSAGYVHDDHGNIISMPHLASIEYDHADRMKTADLGGGGTAHYVYRADGSRARKVIERIGTKIIERIYLGAYEVYRERDHTDLLLERETLHVMDDKRRVAMVETKTVDTAAGPFTPTPRYRFQLDDHIWSARFECDETGLVISYEEFHPYGTSAYRSARSGVEVSERRYRYTGKERDDETGFQIHGLRYYVPWLGRWTTSDPIGLQGGLNGFGYCRGDPVGKVDPGGTDWKDAQRAAAEAHNAGLAAEARAEPPSGSAESGISDGYDEHRDAVNDGAGGAGPGVRRSGNPDRETDAATVSNDDWYNFLANAEAGAVGVEIPGAPTPSGAPAAPPVDSSLGGVAENALNVLASPVAIGFAATGLAYGIGESAGALTDDSLPDEQRMAAGGRAFGKALALASLLYGAAKAAYARGTAPAPDATKHGPTVPEMKNQLFLKDLEVPGKTGQDAALARGQEALRRFQAGTLDIPEGLTRQNLVDYRSAAQGAIEKSRGKPSGPGAEAVQSVRIQLIDEILKSGRR